MWYILAKRETVENSFKYAGEMYDEERGMYYLCARYYDPRVGRFISEDTNEEQVDNPLNYIDFDGHSPKKSFWKFLWRTYKGITGSERISSVPIIDVGGQ